MYICNQFVFNNFILKQFGIFNIMASDSEHEFSLEKDSLSQDKTYEVSNDSDDDSEIEFVQSAKPSTSNSRGTVSF